MDCSCSERIRVASKWEIPGTMGHTAVSANDHKASLYRNADALAGSDPNDTATTDPLVSVVVPVYRGSQTVTELFLRIGRVFRDLSLSYEVIFVDDSSPDNSWAALTELLNLNTDHVVVVQLMRNFGQHNALMCGFHYVRGKYVITIDDDLQHPPEEIPKLLKAIQATNADVVFGVPDKRHHAGWRNTGSWIAATFFRAVFGTRVVPSAFRIIRRELVEAIIPYSLNYTYIDGLLAWNTQRMEQAEVEHHPRAVGRSGYSLRKLLVLTVNLFTTFSLVPLQFVSLIGMLVAMGGLFMGAYYLVLYLRSSIGVPGYASVIVAVLVLGGLQLVALGVHGEYLGRLHLNVNRRPQYLVRSVCDRRP